MPRLIQASGLIIGDVLVNAYNKCPRTVYALRPVLTTATGKPRIRPASQVTIESKAEDQRLYSDTVYLGSLIRIR
jgi:hypothetical protein